MSILLPSYIHQHSVLKHNFKKCWIHTVTDLCCRFRSTYYNSVVERTFTFFKLPMSSLDVTQTICSYPMDRSIWLISQICMGVNIYTNMYWLYTYVTLINKYLTKMYWFRSGRFRITWNLEEMVPRYLYISKWVFN